MLQEANLGEPLDPEGVATAALPLLAREKLGNLPFQELRSRPQHVAVPHERAT